MAQKVVTWKELEEHTYYYKCWVLIEGNVYNVTDFLVEHPGGDDILVKFSGRDATANFNGVPHSDYAVSLRNARLVGKIESSTPPEGYLDRIAANKAEFTKKNKKPLVVRTDKITWEEVKMHKSQESCWIVIENKVYDVSSYIDEHPGGISNIMDHAGKDATQPFLKALHSQQANRIRSKYYIGEVEPKSNLPILIIILLLLAAGAFFLLVRA